jgi:hypothetical protein
VFYWVTNQQVEKTNMLEKKMTSSLNRMVRSLALIGSFQAAMPFMLDASAFAQESFPMVCRGGGGMRAEIRANGSMRVFFTPAAQGANTAPPGPGQCTFLDRALRPGEPTDLLTTFGAARSLVDAMVSGGAFDVHVFNNNQGAMQVTRVGP